MIADKRRLKLVGVLRGKAVAPTWDHRVRTWLMALGVIVLGWLIVERVATYLSHVTFAVTVFLGGVFLAYLIYPAVRGLNRWAPLWASIAIMYGAFAAAVGLTLYFVVPIALSDLDGFMRTLPHLQQLAQRYVDEPGFQRGLPAPLRSQASALPGIVAAYVQHDARSLAADVVPYLLSAVTVGALFVAIPVVTAYMLVEAQPIQRFLLEVLPVRMRERARELVGQLDFVVGGFVRGQMLVAVTVGIMTGAMLLLLHVPYAILIGVWAGVVDLIPYLGAPAGAIPGVGAALLANGLGDAAWASLGFGLMYWIEGNLIAPRIVSKTVRISPLVVVFAVIAGGEAFGLTGMLVAVPICGIVRVVLENTQALHARTLHVLVPAQGSEGVHPAERADAADAAAIDTRAQAVRPV